MRRSGFARKVYAPAPVAPLTPITGCTAVMARASSEVVAVPKMQLLRSRSYRMWVAKHDCFGCGIGGLSQCAHPNQAKYGKGRSIKSGDQFCFPLCGPRPGHQGCHVVHDQSLDCTREECDKEEDGYVIRMQRMAREAGRKEIA